MALTRDEVEYAGAVEHHTPNAGTTQRSAA